MRAETIRKVKGLINIANKGGYLVIGADNLKNYHKKMYLIIKSDKAGKNLIKICERVKKDTSCEVIDVEDEIIEDLVSMSNCKIVGIKNKGFCDEILKIIRGENID